MQTLIFDRDAGQPARLAIMSAFGLILLMVVALLVQGCAQSGGLLTPQTANERIAAAQAGVTQARVTATQLLQAKKISSDDAANVLKQTDAAREGIDVARTLSATDPAGASSRLQTTLAILTALQTYLASRQGP
jgi:hypothetical protein